MKKLGDYRVEWIEETDFECSILNPAFARLQMGRVEYRKEMNFLPWPLGRGRKMQI
jgi:hypothetical protein